jgi:hypothetical protein
MPPSSVDDVERRWQGGTDHCEREYERQQPERYLAGNGQPSALGRGRHERSLRAAEIGSPQAAVASPAGLDM